MGGGEGDIYLFKTLKNGSKFKTLAFWKKQTPFIDETLLLEKGQKMQTQVDQTFPPHNSKNSKKTFCLLLMSSLIFFSKTLFQCLLQILDMARRGKCLCFRKEGKHPQYEKCIVDIGIWLEKLKCKTKSAPHKVCAVLTSLLFVNNLYGRHFNS